MDRTTVSIIIASALILLVGVSGVKAGCCCPTFWTAFDRHCYRLFSYNKTWVEAESFCQSYSVPSRGDEGTSRSTLGHLVSVHSQEEQNFIYTLYDTSRKKEGGIGGLWLGLHDLTTEGSLEWSDGSSVDFGAWAPGQPDSSTSESDCGVIRTNPHDGLWRDGPCVQPPSGTIHYLICKLPMW